MATASAIALCPAPSIPTAAWFARGSGHNEKAQYSERPDDYENNMDRLAHKFETARTLVPKPEIVRNDGNDGRHHRLRHLAHAHRGELRPVAERTRRRGRLPAPARLSLHARGA